MRKHIFGFFLFSSIIVLSVTVFALLNPPPILQVEEVEQAFFEYAYLEGNPEELTFEVQSVQFDLDTGKLISRIRLRWNGQSPPPKNLWINAVISDDGKKSETAFAADVLRDPFRGGSQVLITSQTPGSHNLSISREDNYYALFAVSDNSNRAYFSENASSKRTPVLFAHGEQSKIDR